MAHPYPPHLASFDYVGQHSYALEFTTDARAPTFTDADAVRLVLEQFLRAAREKLFVIIAYCFMPDHVHLIITGTDPSSDCLAFIKAAKQYSGYYFKQRWKRRLWERYGYERTIRDEAELARQIRYLLANPVAAGLVADPSEYAFVGSEKYATEELLEWSNYRSEAALS